jgi:hypothetical protein
LAASRLPGAGGSDEAAVPERVTVEFHPRGSATEVVISHDLIADAATRKQHEQGWYGCLDGLVRHLD